MKFKNPVSVVSPVNGEHATNKDYVDNKQKTINWDDYQALSEPEKRNGTLYDIPDMPTAGQGGIITTYTALEQLGLSAGASVADIVNAMPDCSYAEIGCHREENPYGLEYITGLPNGDGNFILTIRKYNLYRVDIQAKTSASGAVMNDLYIGGMLANGTTVEWKRVCTTSVEDVVKTLIAFSDVANYRIYNQEFNFYRVENGQCYFYVYIEVVSPTSVLTEACQLPIPKETLLYKAPYWRVASSGSAENIQITIEHATGNLKFAGGTVGATYLLHGQYPVAE